MLVLWIPTAVAALFMPDEALLLIDASAPDMLISIECASCKFVIEGRGVCAIPFLLRTITPGRVLYVTSSPLSTTIDLWILLESAKF